MGFFWWWSYFLEDWFHLTLVLSILFWCSFLSRIYKYTLLGGEQVWTQNFLSWIQCKLLQTFYKYCINTVLSQFIQHILYKFTAHSILYWCSLVFCIVLVGLQTPILCWSSIFSLYPDKNPAPPPSFLPEALIWWGGQIMLQTTYDKNLKVAKKCSI